MSEFAYDLRHTLPLDFGARELRKKAALLIDQLGAWVDASSALTKSTPYDDDLGAKEAAAEEAKNELIRLYTEIETEAAQDRG